MLLFLSCDQRHVFASWLPGVRTREGNTNWPSLKKSIHGLTGTCIKPKD